MACRAGHAPFETGVDSHVCVQSFLKLRRVVSPIRWVVNILFGVMSPGLEVINPEYSLRLKIKLNDLLLADTCPQAANHCALF